MRAPSPLLLALPAARARGARWWMAALGAVIPLASCGRPQPQAPALTVEAYVWQAPGRPGVAAAVERSRDFIHTHHFRAAELRWTGRRFEVDSPVRDSLPAPGCGLVVRVGSSASGLEWTAERRRVLEQVVSGLAALHPREIQCDYDCPQRRLDDYRGLLGHLRAAAGAVPVVPTALPSWLGEPSFAALARESPGYVLQVHSLGLPASPDAPVRLMDADQARAAVAAAARLGVPFRVAMATYGCEVWFDPSGKVVEVISEDRPPDGGAPARRAFGYADPRASAELVAAWTRDRPAGLTGIIWYRLPVQGDRRNWPLETLAAAARGRSPAAAITVERKPGGRGGDVVLANHGTAPGRMPERIVARGPVAASDAVGPYRPAPSPDGAAFVLRGDAWPWLAPGQSLVIGWLTTDHTGDRIEWTHP